MGERAWAERRVGAYVVRVAIGGQNDAYADFEVLVDEYEQGDLRCKRVAAGSVKFDGCANVYVEHEDGSMLHFCDRAGVEGLGRSLLVAREMCGRLIPKWCGDEVVEDDRMAFARRLYEAHGDGVSWDDLVDGAVDGSFGAKSVIAQWLDVVDAAAAAFGVPHG